MFCVLFILVLVLLLLLVLVIRVRVVFITTLVVAINAPSFLVRSEAHRPPSPSVLVVISHGIETP